MLNLRELPEFQEQFAALDSIWRAWATKSYVAQLQQVIRSPREQRVAWFMQELAKPLAIAMRDIPMDDDWPAHVDAAVAGLWTSDPAFQAIVRAQGQFLDDLIEAALMPYSPEPPHGA